MQFLFILGRKSAFAFAECSRVLKARFPNSTCVLVTEQIAAVEGIELSDATFLQTLLGGVVKIVLVQKVSSEQTREQLEDACAKLLASLAKERKKISFGVAEIGRDTLAAVRLSSIKSLLGDLGVTARFVEGLRDGLSASVLLHQNVDECVILRTKEQTFVGYTVAIQNIDDWTKRDRAKPAVDRKHGMLPPKVARMMINLALPGGFLGKTVLDPFCGTGTVLLESLLLGADAIGSDMRIEAVGQTQKNCEWLVTQYPVQSTFRTIVADATHISLAQVGSPVDAIVAEGFLGAQTPRPGAVPNQMRGLEKLYRGALKQWRTILKDGSMVVIALPRMNTGKTALTLSSVVDSACEFGYTTMSGPYIYDRPDAIVAREIFVLEYRKK